MTTPPVSGNRERAIYPGNAGYVCTDHVCVAECACKQSGDPFGYLPQVVRDEEPVVAALPLEGVPSDPPTLFDDKHVEWRWVDHWQVRLPGHARWESLASSVAEYFPSPSRMRVWAQLFPAPRLQGESNAVHLDNENRECPICDADLIDDSSPKGWHCPACDAPPAVQGESSPPSETKIAEMERAVNGLAAQCVTYRDQLDTLIAKGQPRSMICCVRSALGDRDAVACRHPWPIGVYVQGSVPMFGGPAFVEACRPDAVYRGEGESLDAAEDGCWSKYIKDFPVAPIPEEHRDDEAASDEIRCNECHALDGDPHDVDCDGTFVRAPASHRETRDEAPWLLTMVKPCAWRLVSVGGYAHRLQDDGEDIAQKDLAQFNAAGRGDDFRIDALYSGEEIAKIAKLAARATPLKEPR